MKYCSFIKRLAQTTYGPMLGIVLGISLVGCQQKPSQHNQSDEQSISNQPAIEQDEDDQVEQPLCKKIGERCRLRPGVLGVCSPSQPMNNGLIQQIAPNPLHCTPQH